MEVYFNEFNIAMDNTIYLPIVSGLLSSYAKTNTLINKKYEFMPFLFMREDPDKIFSQYKNPSVAAFSASMWNSNLSLEVASKVKQKFPESLIVFGGPQVPFDAEDYFQANPFIDITVRGEGEKTFSEILERLVESKDFEGIEGISYRDRNERYVKNKKERGLIKNLDDFPSPYLDGTFDMLIKNNPEINFQAIIETNRGCPFLCSYCFWGQGGLNKRFRFFSIDRVKQIAEWTGKNKIAYVFCADSNFGMFKRDLDVAQAFVDAKNKYGFPEKIRVCYGKNAEESIYQVGRLLHQYDMEKGITLSLQTHSPIAASNVNRKNIRTETYNSLQRRYNNANIPTYTEMILGLPGETYESFSEGLESVLQAGIKNQLFVYHCQVYPNTELADKYYQKRFGISISRVPLNENHSSFKADTSVIEYEDLIVSTNSMPKEDWANSTKLSWVMQMLHGLKLGFYPLYYLANTHNIKYTDFYRYFFESRLDRTKMINRELENFDKTIDSILNQRPYRQILPDFGPLYWEQEEASYLNIISDKDSLYNELFGLTKEFLQIKGKEFDEEKLAEVLEYQKARVPTYRPPSKVEHSFRYNIPEYFDSCFSDNKTELQDKPQKMVLKYIKDFREDKEEFAIHVLLRGRKSNKMLYPVDFFDL